MQSYSNTSQRQTVIKYGSVFQCHIWDWVKGKRTGRAPLQIQWPLHSEVKQCVRRQQKAYSIQKSGFHTHLCIYT